MWTFSARKLSSFKNKGNAPQLNNWATAQLLRFCYLKYFHQGFAEEIKDGVLKQKPIFEIQGVKYTDNICLFWITVKKTSGNPKNLASLTSECSEQ